MRLAFSKIKFLITLMPLHVALVPSKNMPHQRPCLYIDEIHPGLLLSDSVPGCARVGRSGMWCKSWIIQWYGDSSFNTHTSELWLNGSVPASSQAVSDTWGRCWRGVYTLYHLCWLIATHPAGSLRWRQKDEEPGLSYASYTTPTLTPLSFFSPFAGCIRMSEQIHFKATTCSKGAI